MPISSENTISVYRKFLLGYVKVNFILTVMRRLKLGIKDFGEVEVVDTSPTEPQLLPSQKIDPEKLKHLSA